MSLTPRYIPNVSNRTLLYSAFIRSYPIASIDWGYGQMAYCAAHLIIGDIPISVTRDGVMMSKCMLIDRGSLGPAHNVNHRTASARSKYALLKHSP